MISSDCIADFVTGSNTTCVIIIFDLELAVFEKLGV